MVIKCTDGSCFTGHYCIVTLPLGVLKRPGLVEFIPRLPSDKMRAMGWMNSNSLDRIVLIFDQCWWEGGGPGHKGRLPTGVSWYRNIDSSSAGIPLFSEWYSLKAHMDLTHPSVQRLFMILVLSLQSQLVRGCCFQARLRAKSTQLLFMVRCCQARGRPRGSSGASIQMRDRQENQGKLLQKLKAQAVVKGV